MKPIMVSGTNSGLASITTPTVMIMPITRAIIIGIKPKSKSTAMIATII